MNTLYIHLPCKACADRTTRLPDIACQYAWVIDKAAIEREAVASVTDLSAMIAKAQRVVVMLAASDVTLLQTTIPPLPAAKLRAALPNLVEDQILGNLADCTVVADGVSKGLRTVAVIQRDWLDQVYKTFTKAGARQISILPAQLCLPHQAGRVAAAIIPQEEGADLTLRLSEQTGLGLALSVHQPEQVIHNVCAIVPNSPITLYMPQKDMQAYQSILNHAGLAQRISLAVSAWPVWIAGARNTTLNLLAGLDSASTLKMDWRPWRWPLVLATALLTINIASLNLDWWQMSREAKNLRTALTQIYLSRYPKESVVIDPIAQMQQKIAFAKRDAGLAASDDFTALAANFGETWNSIHPADKPALVSLEYREHALLVSFKAKASEALQQQMQTVLAQRHLSLTTASSQSGAVAWQIRSMR